MKISKKIQKYLKYSAEKFFLTAGYLEKKRLEKFERRIKDWKNGKTPRATEPAKYQNILNHARKHGLKTMIETGTYHGDSIYALKNYFDRIYSIELSEEYYRLSKYRLSKYSHITLIQGDSYEELKKVVFILEQPAIFWLDAHYGCYKDQGAAIGTEHAPVIAELDSIFNSTIAEKHIILIDDANAFTKDNDYPKIEDVCETLRSKGHNFAIEHDTLYDCFILNKL